MLAELLMCVNRVNQWNLAALCDARTHIRRIQMPAKYGVSNDSATEDTTY